MVLDCHQLNVTPSFVKIGQLPLQITWGGNTDTYGMAATAFLPLLEGK
jgi:hypothetical protein